ncbi:MAG: hypothetical protein HY823_05010 [Acidobacteria bacterium]|nr:hypothetical protein [Acidobacteriota bacterium]
MTTPAFRPPGLRSALRLLGLLFVATGGAGLLAEQVFEKLATSLLGASTPAAAVVLAVYFMGLTSGSLAYPRLRALLRHPLRGYGLLESGVALWSLLLFLAHPVLVTLLAPLLRLGAGHFWLLQALRLLVACLWILPPTFLMGATFPAVVDALEALRVPQPKRAMARFYSLNLAGAIVGALAGPYLAFPEFGLGGTLLLTALVDAGAAALALYLFRSLERRTRVPLLARRSEGTGAVRGRGPLLAVALLSGFLFFGLEVLWAHLIGAVLGNSVYAFAAMLAMVLGGLALGGSLSTLLFRERRPISAGAVGMLFVAGSALLAWQFGLWPRVPGLLTRWGGGLQSFGDAELLRWIVAGILLLPPAAALGMVYPALFRIREFPDHDRAALASRLGAANSIGCVLGALGTGFLILPRLGSERSLVLIGTLLLACGGVLALAYMKGPRRWLLVAAALVVGGAWGFREGWNPLALTSGEHVYFRPAFVGPGSRLLYFHEDTLGGITTVVERPSLEARAGAPPSFTRTLLTNGKFQANDAGEVDAQTGFALIPTLHCRNFEDALVIGLGSGHSAEVVHRAGFKRLDVAEISPGIIQAARGYFRHINGGVLDQPNVKISLEDGRNHLLLQPRRYDLITMEISSIWFAGSTSLYCEEFYELAAKRLNPGGVLQQWIQVHHLGLEELGSVVATARKRFPFVSFWLYGGQGILVATREPQELQPGALSRVRAAGLLAGPEGEAVLLARLLGSRLLVPSDLDRFLAAAPFPTNTDFNRYLEYASPKYNLRPEPYERINAAVFGRFASFPGYGSQPLPEPFAAWVQGVTPEAHRRILGLQPAPPPGPATGR